MKKNKENFIVRKLHDQYVGNNCAQIMLGYTDNMTVIGEDGILFHAPEAEKDSIDIFKYLEDERKKEFPYHNTPAHYERRLFHPTQFFVNQLFDYNKPYIVIRDKFVQQLYLKKSDKGVYSFFGAPTASEPEIAIQEDITKENILRGLCSQNDSISLYVIDYDGLLYNPFASKEEIIKNRIDFIKYLEKNDIYYEYDDVSKRILYNNRCVRNKFVPNTLLNNKTPKFIVTVNNNDIETKVVELEKISNNTICTKVYDVLFDVAQKAEEYEEEKTKVKSLKEPKVRR